MLFAKGVEVANAPSIMESKKSLQSLFCEFADAKTGISENNNISTYQFNMHLKSRPFQILAANKFALFQTSMVCTSENDNIPTNINMHS